jgi:BAG domain
MTLLSDWPVTLSSLGEASISFPQQIIRRLASLESSTSLSLSPFIEFIENIFSSSPHTALFVAVVAGLLVIGAMSWRDKLNFWQRSPSYGGSSHHHHNTTPEVNDSDFSYLTENDIVEPPRSHQQQHYVRQRAQMDDSGPDIIVLKHRGVVYPLRFHPYAIDDGVLTVGEIRRRAAEQIGTAEVQRIKMLYKGKLLRDDSTPCKDEGLKQQSEIMCVVSEVRPGESTSDLSGSEVGNRSESVVSLDSGGNNNNNNDDHQQGSSGGGGGGGGGRRKKNKKKKKQSQPAAASNLAPPSDARPTSSGRSSAPSPAPSIQHLSTGNEQVDVLLRYLRTELAPPSEQYIAQPPTDPKAREFEHKRLGEMILAQVILKADSIDSEDARTARRALIKEAQGLLNRLDAAAPKEEQS